MKTRKTDRSKPQIKRLTQSMLMFLAALLLMLIMLLLAWPASSAQPNGNLDRIQGPQQGELVRPPSRNVTPGFQLSPLHQKTPLQREEGKVVPKVSYPDREVPRLFRNPIVTSANKLALGINSTSTRDAIIVKLAHIHLPKPSRLCWRFDAQISCHILGKSAFKRFLRQRAIVCDWLTETSSAAKGGAVSEAVCYTGPGILDHKPGQSTNNIQDLASWLVSWGWALPEVGYYSAQHDLAKREKRGIYAVESDLAPPSQSAAPSSIPDIMGKINPLTFDHVILGDEEEELAETPLPSLIGEEEYAPLYHD